MRDNTPSRWTGGLWGLGIVLIGLGWGIDFYSSGDPHFWDTLGWIVVATAIFTHATRWGTWFENLRAWATPHHLLTSVLFASLLGFTTFYWYVTSALAAKSAEPGLSEGAAGVLRWVTRGNETFFLPMLAGITGLAFVSLLMTFSKNTSKAISP